MDTHPIDRRRFILAAIAATAGLGAPRGMLPGGSAWAREASDATLAELTRQFFPHPGLADAAYTRVAASVFESLLANPSTAQLLDDAGAALDAEVDGSWIDAATERQVAALQALEGEAFFGALLAQLRFAFYHDPAVWAHLEYPGSSKEYGGYKHRGFDDIDWLPEVE